MSRERSNQDVIPGRIVDDRVVQPGNPWVKVIPQGAVLRIIDLEGKQAVDFLCYNAKDPSERYNACDSLKFSGNIYLTKGSALYSDMGRPIYTIVEDTCGRHDTIGGCCSAESNHFRYGVKDTENCRDTFLRGFSEAGLGRKDIVPNVNFFMNVPVRQDGSVAISDGLSVPGDFVDLKAEMDALTVISNCPQRHNPCCGYNPTPIRIVIWEPT